MTKSAENCGAMSANLKTHFWSVLESHIKHFPWGLPESREKDADDTIILTQKNYITGYKTSLRLPSWVGYKLIKEVPFYILI